MPPEIHRVPRRRPEPADDRGGTPAGPDSRPPIPSTPSTPSIPSTPPAAPSVVAGPAPAVDGASVPSEARAEQAAARTNGAGAHRGPRRLEVGVGGERSVRPGR